MPEYNKKSHWYNTLKNSDSDLYDMVNTYADLENYKKPKEGIKVQVNSDETHNNDVVTYVYKNKKWEIAPESKHVSVISKYLDNKKKNINNLSGITRNVYILQQYGLSPTLINDAVRLYDEQNDQMIQVVGISRDNETNKQIPTKSQDKFNDIKVDLNKEKIIIRPYSKVMYAPDEYTNNVTFATVHSPTYEMTVADFIDQIYDLPCNQKAIKNAEKGVYLDDKEIVLQKLQQRDMDTNQKRYDTIADFVKNIDPNLYKDIKDEDQQFKLLDILKSKKLAGFTEDDLKYIVDIYSKYLEWQESISQEIKAVKNADTVLGKVYKNNKEAKKELDDNLKIQSDWFEQGLTGEKLKKQIAKWYKRYKDTTSTVSEASKYISPVAKPLKVVDPGEVADILVDLGIDTRFLRVPFVNLDDKKRYRIRGFKSIDDIHNVLNLIKNSEVNKISQLESELADKKQQLDIIKTTTKDAKEFLRIANLYNQIQDRLNQALAAKKQLAQQLEKTVVLIKRYEDGKETGLPVEISLNDLMRYMNASVNVNAELDVPEHDLANPNENLNQNKFDLVDLDSEDIKNIIKQVRIKFKDKAYVDYYIPHNLNENTWEDYYDTPILLDVLNMANSKEFENYKIVKNKVKGKIIYRGVVPENPNAKMNAFPRKSITKMV